MNLLEKIESRTLKIGIIGLGYVGLPLAVEFGKKYTVTGFDINQERIEELRKGHDRTLEVSDTELAEAEGLQYTSNLDDLRISQVFIVTVPTPIDSFKRPDLTPLLKASESVGRVLKKGDIVVYESTVYPGCTEEDCVPVLEKFSGLKFNEDFFCGYSPERINPGDKEHRVSTIKKVVSGSTLEIGRALNELYKSIIVAGTHLASTMKVAEAAKVIENTQRDINIAFVNELAKLFNAMGIDTNEVLHAAGTKWNFLPYKPGLVGGHCIGVDPYYLTHKAVAIGYHPEIILAGRRINDGMGSFIATQFVKYLIKKEIKIYKSKILILGITFKENCPDIRNSKVIDIINELKEYGCKIDVFDNWANEKEVFDEYGIKILNENSLVLGNYSGIIIAVAHDGFIKLLEKETITEKQVIYDIKGIMHKQIICEKL